MDATCMGDSHSKTGGPPKLAVLGEAPSGPEFLEGLAPRGELPPTVRISTEGPVFYREWVVGPGGTYGWIAGLCLASSLEIAGALLLAFLAPAGPVWVVLGVLLLIAGSLLTLTSIAFRGLALEVDRAGIGWGFGPIRRRFALSEIVMFRARDFAFRKFGGWGVGRAHDGVDVYEVWGANGTALDLVVTRAGATRHFLVSTVAPEQVCAALVRANGR